MGAVGQCAIMLAKRAGATVLATVRKESEIETLRAFSKIDVFLSDDKLKDQVRAQFPEGIDHIIEVAFSANIDTDVALLKNGGSIATYATLKNPAEIPYWLMVFSNLSVHFLGSDDFPVAAKSAAAKELAQALADGWPGLHIGQVYSLNEIADAHEHLEQRKPGRALLKVMGKD